MWTENATVRVLEGKELDGGYVELEHQQVYSLVLRNNRDVDADATVEIDGKVAGIWRVGARRSITLERPANDKGRFTFLRHNTPEFEAAQLSESNPSLGLVKVTFRFGTKVTPLAPVVSPLPWDEYLNPLTNDWTYKPDSNTGGPIRYRTSSTSEPIAMAALSSGGGTQSRSSNTVASADVSTYSSNRSGGTGLTGRSNQDFYSVAPLTYDESWTTIIHLRLIATQAVRPLRSLTTPIPPRL